MSKGRSIKVLVLFLSMCRYTYILYVLGMCEIGDMEGMSSSGMRVIMWKLQVQVGCLREGM